MEGVRETLRKYPVLPFLDRTCLRDYKVENSDLVIEKDLDVYIPMFALHYNPEFFPQPQKYDPQRFADKCKINNEGLYYVPFGDGPRICIVSNGIVVRLIPQCCQIYQLVLEVDSSLELQRCSPVKEEPIRLEAGRQVELHHLEITAKICWRQIDLPHNGGWEEL
ncbi:hypothetical protein HUJ04_010820 [Dendroctonus ponderosae]|nr:hypothetical protein HUJ04_010820 [Dendroctonus ponderosae]